MEQRQARFGGSAHAPASGAVRRVLNALQPMVTRYRLLVALKAAIGVTAAWFIARLLPGELREYAYYAPLGALLGVAPTIVSSVRTSLELIAGIVLGVALGWALVGTGTPWYVRAPIAAGVGMLIAGARILGEGRVYVPIAGVFVVILGAGDTESYVAGYVVQFGIGLLVGTLVNVVFIPPLGYGYATARVAELKADFAAAADDLASVLGSDWPPDRSDWLDDARRWQRSVDDAEELVREAKESGRGNLRALWRRDSALAESADIEALRFIGLRLSDVSDALGGAIWHQPVAVSIPPDAMDALGRALGELAEYIRAWNTGVDLGDAHERCTAAVRELGEVFERSEVESGFGSIVFALRSMLGRIDERTADNRS